MEFDHNNCGGAPSLARRVPQHATPRVEVKLRPNSFCSSLGIYSLWAAVPRMTHNRLQTCTMLLLYPINFFDFLAKWNNFDFQHGYSFPCSSQLIWVPIKAGLQLLHAGLLFYHVLLKRPCLGSSQLYLSQSLPGFCFQRFRWKLWDRSVVCSFERGLNWGHLDALFSFWYFAVVLCYRKRRSAEIL